MKNVDSAFWRRFKVLFKLLFKREIAIFLFPITALLIVFVLLISFTFGQLSRARGLIVDSLTRGEEDFFWSSLKFFLLVSAFLITIDVLKRFTEDRLVLRLRRAINIYFLSKYLSFNVSYMINLKRSVDNPDQRIEEDTRTFCAQTISLFLIFVGAVSTLIVQGSILIKMDLGLLLVAIAYAIIGSTLTFLVGKKLITLNWLQLMKEANYRFKLISLRENAEAINLFRENKKELTRARQYLREAIKNFINIISVNRNLGFVTGAYNNLIWLIPHLFLASEVFKGVKTYGQVTMATMAFEHFLNALSLIVSHFTNLSSYAAVVNRLGALHESVTQESKNNYRIQPSQSVVFKNVTIFIPTDNKELISNLSFAHTGGGMLIMGDSGVGKSAIIRVIAGIWDSFTGTVFAPNPEECIFLPQKPYCFEASFLSQLLYGVKKIPPLDLVLKTAEFCGLNETMEKHGGLSAIRDWTKVLSLGEQQKIAWVRLFLSNKKFCFVDEMTTALDVETEDLFFKELANRSALWISIGVRESLFKHHKVKLILKGRGKWDLLD